MNAHAPLPHHVAFTILFEFVDAPFLEVAAQELALVPFAEALVVDVLHVLAPRLELRHGRVSVALQR